jgi:hypothetical protein
MSSDVARTPLHAFHLRHGARMVPFAGYAMPVQYPAGLLKEHLHTRAQAGLFDVSHMGQIRLTPRSGTLADAALALETLLPIDVLGLKPGRQRYGLLLDETGGIRDDLMVAHDGDSLVLVVNAANKVADESYLRAHLSDVCTVTVLARALVALQGPGAEAALARLAPEVAAMRFMDVRTLDLVGAPALVTRSGYTGEDASRFPFRKTMQRLWPRRCWPIPPCCRSASGPAIPCAWKRACVCTATTSIPAPIRSRPACPGPPPPRAVAGAPAPAVSRALRASSTLWRPARRAGASDYAPRARRPCAPVRRSSPTRPARPWATSPPAASGQP